MGRTKDKQIQDINARLERLTELLDQLGKADRDQWGQMFEVLQDMNGICNDTGLYFVLPTEPLLMRGETFYNTNVEAVRDYLTHQTNKDGEHLDAETIATVTDDYARMFAGCFKFEATPEQMQHVLTCCRPQGAFMVERYAFYFSLLLGYTYCLRAVATYRDIIITEQVNGRDSDVTRRAKLQFLKGPDDMRGARGVDWLNERGLFDAVIFTGVTNPATVSLYLDRVDAFARLGEYVQYYIIAKYCLSATPEELAAIPQPPTHFDAEHSNNTAADFADYCAQKAADNLNDLAAKFTDVITAEREQDTQQAREQAAEQSETIAADRVKIPETFGLILSRDVFGAVNGNTNDILPIQAFINDYMERKGLTDAITPRTVEKTIEGLNLLQRIQRVTPVNGLYSFNTNISKFAELCGFTDANDEQKREILTALGVLDGMYLVVWRAKGPTAIRVLSIREIGVGGEAKGDLLLDVTTAAMNGRPQLVAWDDFKALRQQAKGKAQNHFRYQIIAKGHKAENALLNEVFGYDNAITEAQQLGTPEDVKQTRETIRKHKARDRKQLQKWFEDYQRGGYINYSTTKNTKGETVYKWDTLRVIHVEPLGPQEQAQEPDEQGEQ